MEILKNSLLKDDEELSTCLWKIIPLATRKTMQHPYTVMQSDWNSSKIDTFHKPTTKTISEEIMTFARHEYGQVGVFRFKIKSLVQKL